MTQALIVDDEEIIQSLYSKALREINFESDNKFDAESALKQLQVKKYDLLLLDNQLPKMCGSTLAKSIRNSENINQSTPIIFLSGFLSDQERIDLLKLENIYFHNKTQKLEHLKKIISEII